MVLLHYVYITGTLRYLNKTRELLLVFNLYIPLAAHAAVSGLRSASGGLHLCALTCQIPEPCHLLKVGEECFQLLTNLAGFFAPHLFICGGSRFRCGGGGGGGGEALPWHRALSAPVRQPTNAAKQRQA